MKNFDILIVGGSSTGCWFAEKMAKEGFDVLVIEKQEEENVSRNYDIFHMGEEAMKLFNLDIPEKNNPIFEFRYEHATMVSPYGNHRKVGGYSPVIGMHKHDYIMYMAEKAKKSGAKFIYGASFTDLIFKNGKVVGAKYSTAEGEQSVYAKLVADCSGIPSVARTKLSDVSCVGNFKLTPKDIFYVVLYYVNFKNRNMDPRSLDGSFMQYKSWLSPAGKEADSILGIGANYSYAYAEELFNSHFIKNVTLPEYTVKKIEKGMTPYHPTLYSFVDNGFIAMGDAACLTKPVNGEGCTSSLVQAEIAADVITTLLKENLPLSKENMWSINKRYMEAQGKSFDFMRPVLIGAVDINYDEAEYLFKKDIIFSEKVFANLNSGLKITPADITSWIAGITIAIAKRKFRPSSIGKVVKGLKQALEIMSIYDAYPETPFGFEEWKKKADAKWAEIGTLADHCLPEILEKIGN